MAVFDVESGLTAVGHARASIVAAWGFAPGGGRLRIAGRRGGAWKTLVDLFALGLKYARHLLRIALFSARSGAGRSVERTGGAFLESRTGRLAGGAAGHAGAIALEALGDLFALGLHHARHLLRISGLLTLLRATLRIELSLCALTESRASGVTRRSAAGTAGTAAGPLETQRKLRALGLHHARHLLRIALLLALLTARSDVERPLGAFAETGAGRIAGRSRWDAAAGLETLTDLAAFGLRHAGGLPRIVRLPAVIDAGLGIERPWGALVHMGARSFAARPTRRTSAAALETLGHLGALGLHHTGHLRRIAGLLAVADAGIRIELPALGAFAEPRARRLAGWTARTTAVIALEAPRNLCALRLQHTRCPLRVAGLLAFADASFDVVLAL